MVISTFETLPLASNRDLLYHVTRALISYTVMLPYRFG
jgi:hypothetical protein